MFIIVFVLRIMWWFTTCCTWALWYIYLQLLLINGNNLLCLDSLFRYKKRVSLNMGETEQRPTAGSRLGAQENAGISTLEHGQKPPMTPPGKLVSIKIQMLDDTQETFDVPVRMRALGWLKIVEAFLKMHGFKPVLFVSQLCGSVANEFMLQGRGLLYQR